MLRIRLFILGGAFLLISCGVLFVMMVQGDSPASDAYRPAKTVDGSSAKTARTKAKPVRQNPASRQPSALAATKDPVREPEITFSEEGFQRLLQNLESKDPAERQKAQHELLALSNPEKIHWLRIFSQDEDENVRRDVMKAVKICFGWETFSKKTGTTYVATKKRRQAAAEQGHPEDPMAAIPVSFEGLPTKREAVQINDMVRTALSDESQAVRDDALQAAMSFDVETCNMIYQYAITSCDDQMRLAVLKNAEHGDNDFRLRLQMAALDVGGEEVVRVASEGIKKDTGMTFSSSQEAFDWYEKHRAEPDK